MGRTLIIIGVVIVALGVILTVFPKAFSWFGRLPGDIRVERENGTFYFPITTMILISVVLTILANLFSRK
jgi:hypothetical protein